MIVHMYTQHAATLNFELTIDLSKVGTLLIENNKEGAMP